jgi:hypothetical protein
MVWRERYAGFLRAFRLMLMLKPALLLPAILLFFRVATSIDLQQPATSSKTTELLKEIAERSRLARERGNPLMELESLRPLFSGSVRAASDNEPGPDPQQALAVSPSTSSAEIGNYADALKYADMVYGTSSKGKPPTISLIEGYKPVDALAAITTLAENAQLVLINESHHIPQHRAFTYLLLKALRRLGFTHFAAETLSEQDKNLNERGYPIRTSGYYTREPLYGDLVRTAIKLGYRVVPFEWFGEYTPDNRETGMAKNLVERILKPNPKAKVLVHAGYDHINETGEIAGAKTMAQRLKEMTGIDPLTIDQTVMTEHSTPEFEQPLYRYVIEKKRLSEPTVFQNDKGELLTVQKGNRDVTLFHPRAVYEDGRPTWLHLRGDRMPYPAAKGRREFKWSQCHSLCH